MADDVNNRIMKITNNELSKTENTIKRTYDNDDDTNLIDLQSANLHESNLGKTTATSSNPHKVQRTLIECGLWSCKQAKCTEEDNTDMLTCSKCKGKFHYHCTELPPYQIAQFTSMNYAKYLCKICVPIPDDLPNKCMQPHEEAIQKNFNSSNEKLLMDKVICLEKELDISTKELTKYQNVECIKAVSKHKCTQTTATWKTYEQLTDKLNKLEDELQKTEDELERVNNQKNKYKHEISCMKQKLLTAEENQETLRKNIESKDSLLENMKNNSKKANENKILNQQVKQLREQEEIMQKHLEKRDEKIRDLQSRKNLEGTLTENKSHASNDMHKLINERFDKIEKSIDQLVSQNIRQHSPMVQVEKLETKLEEVISNNQSYADKINQNLEANTIASIMKETKNEELVQQRERKLRSCNIIIHGVEDAKENGPAKDKEFVTALFAAIGVDHRPKTIVRLGRPDNNKCRPLLVTMNTDDEKDLVMTRLPNLKNAEDNLKKVSITDDYTVDERNEIKIWVEKAKKRNEDETGDVIWKVRGTPKNGLRLAKFTKRTPQVKRM